MLKYQYSVYKKETGDAGGKAKNDVFDILIGNGFMPSYTPSDIQLIRVIQQYVSIGKLAKGDFIVVQYPAVHNKLLRRLFIKCHDVKCRVAVIHDIRSVQGFGGSISDEVKMLNFFNYVIVHNTAMEQLLRNNGYSGNVVQLQLFDYLHDPSRPVVDYPYSGSICVAGNLDKSQYLSKLGMIYNYHFNLFGINTTQNFNSIDNVTYYGKIPSDEIVYRLIGDYGLVWDGDSITDCHGKYGNYLLYNSPHKLSLYLSAGKPIITWRKAAISQFVLENKVGICVESLDELNTIDLSIGYDLYKENAMKIKKRLANGEYLSIAIKTVERLNER